MKSIIHALENGPLLAGLDKPKVSARTIKRLIREALAELAESPLDKVSRENCLIKLNFFTAA